LDAPQQRKPVHRVRRRPSLRSLDGGGPATPVWIARPTLAATSSGRSAKPPSKSALTGKSVAWQKLREVRQPHRRVAFHSRGGPRGPSKGPALVEASALKPPYAANNRGAAPGPRDWGRNETALAVQGLEIGALGGDIAHRRTMALRRCPVANLTTLPLSALPAPSDISAPPPATSFRRHASPGYES